MNYSAARIIDNQLALKHSALYPYFKEKVSNNDNPALYQYLVYENANGVPEVVGIPWILESTYKSIKGRVMVITIQNWSEAERENYVTFLSNMGATYIMTEKTNNKLYYSDYLLVGIVYKLFFFSGIITCQQTYLHSEMKNMLLIRTSSDIITIKCRSY